MSLLKLADMHPLTWTSIEVIAYFNDVELGVGSAFLWKSEGAIFLVTAGHVVNGRHAETGAALSETLALPNRLFAKFHVELQTSPIELDGAPGQHVTLVRQPVEIPLYADGEGNEPLWQGGQAGVTQLDVAVIDVTTSLPANILTRPVNDSGFDYSNFDFMVGADIFILGFPKGISSRGFPIWKRGSIATEPAIDHKELPMFLIDSATRNGMSGAPVFVKSAPFWLPKGGTGLGDSVFGAGTAFAGIYTAREHAKDELEAQLGLVWRKEVIDQLISAFSMKSVH